MAPDPDTVPVCDVCECPFTITEWDDRHSAGPDQTLEVHADCCPECPR